MYLRTCVSNEDSDQLAHLQRLIRSAIEYRHSDLVGRAFVCDWEVTGSIPGQIIPKSLKMILAALSLGTQHYESRARNQDWFSTLKSEH